MLLKQVSAAMEVQEWLEAQTAQDRGESDGFGLTSHSHLKRAVIFDECF